MTAAGALTCRQFVDLVTDYLEDRLPAPARQRFDQHLAECEDCTIYLEQMRQTIRMTGALRPDSLSSKARETLLRAFVDWNAR